MGKKKRGGGGGSEGGKPPPQDNEGGSQPRRQPQGQSPKQAQGQMPKQVQGHPPQQAVRQPQQDQAQRGGQHGHQHQQMQSALPPGFETSIEQQYDGRRQIQTQAPQGVWGRGPPQFPSQQQAPQGRGQPPAGRGWGRGSAVPSPGAPAAVPSRGPLGPLPGMAKIDPHPGMGKSPPTPDFPALDSALKEAPDARPAAEGQQKRPGTQGQKPEGVQPSPAASTSQPQEGPKKAPKADPSRKVQGGARKGRGDAPDMVTSTQPDISLEGEAYPKKPPGELFMRKITVKVNFYDIILDPKHPRKYHYDVKIEQARKESPPETKSKSKATSGEPNAPRRQPTRLFKDVIIKFMENYFPSRRYAYDGGSSIFTDQLLIDENDSFTGQVIITDPDRKEDKEFFVTLKIAENGVIDLSGLSENLLEGKVESKIIQAFDIIFKWFSARRPVIQTKRGFYPIAVTPVEIRGGKQIRPGFTHTVIAGMGLLLNVDVIYKIFPRSGPFINGIINDVCVPQRRDDQPINLNKGLRDYQTENLAEFVKGLKVEFKMGNETRRYRVDGLAECPARNKFDFNGRIITVQKYFEEEKRCKIRYPYLPCLLVKVGRQNRCYPIELGEILPNQVKRFRPNDFDTQQIGEQATCATDERQRRIKREVENLGLHRDEYFRDFGINISPEFKKVDGRILQPPAVEYKNGIPPMQPGKWDARNAKFLDAKKLTKWGSLVFDRLDRDTVIDFENKVMKIGKNLGMEIIEPSDNPYTLKPDISDAKLEEILSGYATDGYELLFVVIPKNKELYSRVKKIADTKVGLLTQCVYGKTITSQRVNDAILNMLIKDNTKLNKLNHTLQPLPALSQKNKWCWYDDTMFLGADVTHPAPQDKTKIPSIAAVVANIDKHASIYKKEWDFQDPNPTDREIIQNLEGMMMKLLKSYKEKVGNYPKRLIFFRDGVSEGQFSEVLRQEIPSIYSASKKLSGSHIPLSFLIVQKRHSTRIFPLDEEKNKFDKKNFNVPPGTVVDRVIVGQDMHQFYLVSHESMLGTARPTRYKMIWDHCKLSSDEIQHMTYFLCHMFNRCARSVSYPAPTYYAHLACFRIRNYLLTEQINMENLRSEKERLKANLRLDTENPSYFI